MQRKTITAHIQLRSTQVDYLEYVANRDEVSVSYALGAILDANDFNARIPAVRPPQKATKHVGLSPRHHEILNQLAVKWGLSKSDVVRRLIDIEIAANGTPPRRIARV